MLRMTRADIHPLQPADCEVLKALLRDAGLTVTDITPALLNDFLAMRSGMDLIGAAGIECYGDVGLLRSVVVAAPQRGTGLGKQLVAATEALARERGIRYLYLLTDTAEQFFAACGYRALVRDEAPAAISHTVQFSQLCPGSSAFMMKELW
jgi:amino-acid N-acetyltransferase